LIKQNVSTGSAHWCYLLQIEFWFISLYLQTCSVCKYLLCTVSLHNQEKPTSVIVKPVRCVHTIAEQDRPNYNT